MRANCWLDIVLTCLVSFVCEFVCFSVFGVVTAVDSRLAYVVYLLLLLVGWCFLI